MSSHVFYNDVLYAYHKQDHLGVYSPGREHLTKGSLELHYGNCSLTNTRD